MFAQWMRAFYSVHDFKIHFLFSLFSTLCRVSSPNSRRRSCRRPPRSQRRRTSWRRFCSKPSIPSTRPSEFPRVKSEKKKALQSKAKRPLSKKYVWCGIPVWLSEQVWTWSGRGSLYCERRRTGAREVPVWWGTGAGGPFVTCDWPISSFVMVTWDPPSCGQNFRQTWLKTLPFINFVDGR